MVWYNYSRLKFLSLAIIGSCRWWPGHYTGQPADISWYCGHRWCFPAFGPEHTRCGNCSASGNGSWPSPPDSRPRQCGSLPMDGNRRYPPWAPAARPSGHSPCARSAWGGHARYFSESVPDSSHAPASSPVRSVCPPVGGWGLDGIGFAPSVLDESVFDIWLLDPLVLIVRSFPVIHIWVFRIWTSRIHLVLTWLAYVRGMRRLVEDILYIHDLALAVPQPIADHVPGLLQLLQGR